MKKEKPLWRRLRDLGIFILSVASTFAAVEENSTVKALIAESLIIFLIFEPVIFKFKDESDSLILRGFIILGFQMIFSSKIWCSFMSILLGILGI